MPLFIVLTATTANIQEFSSFTSFCCYRSASL